MALQKLRKPVAASLIAALCTTSATVARADGGDFLGGLVTGAIGGVLINEAARNNKRNRTRTTTRTYVPAPAHAEGREIQTSLNYFGFQAGVVDGVLGSNSRAAIRRYQAYMGYNVTGRMTTLEKNILLSAYQRGSAGGYETERLINREGVRALLQQQREIMIGGTAPSTGYAGLPMEVSRAVDEVAESSDPSAEQLLKRSGFIQLADLNSDGSTDYIIDTALSGSSFWCSAQSCKSLVFVSTPDGYARNDLMVHEPVPAKFDCTGPSCTVAQGSGNTQMAAQEMPETGGGGDGTTMASTGGGDATLPLFDVQEPAKSLSSHCRNIPARGDGYGDISGVVQAKAVMGAEFCLARDEAISTSRTAVRNVQGVTAAQVDAQCAGLGDRLERFVTAASAKDRGTVLDQVGNFVLDSGAEPARLIGTARICLGSGYAQDDMSTALGSALLLVALGEKPYAELVGHHLSQGYGTPERRDLATQWYALALSSLESGATPVFATDEPDRDLLLREAALELEGMPRAGDTQTTQDESAVPVFEIAE